MSATSAPLSLCQLFQSLKQFHGKVIEVRGYIGETIGLSDPDCRVGPMIEGVKWPPALDLTFGTRQAVHEINRIRSQIGSGRVAVIVQGTLIEHTETSFYIDSKGQRKKVGFGHLNAFPATLKVTKVRVIEFSRE